MESSERLGHKRLRTLMKRSSLWYLPGASVCIHFLHKVVASRFHHLTNIGMEPSLYCYTDWYLGRMWKRSKLPLLSSDDRYMVEVHQRSVPQASEVPVMRRQLVTIRLSFVPLARSNHRFQLGPHGRSSGLLLGGPTRRTTSSETQGVDKFPNTNQRNVAAEPSFAFSFSFQ